MQGFEAATVSDLVSSIKDTLEEKFNEVMVQGEVSNLSPSAAGHWYFTLSDPNASISCALFKMDALRNPLIRTLKDGDKIVLLGPISVYQKRGTFQVLAKRIMPAGEGQLKLQYERLKAKLSQEGYFDLEKKKPIPKFPHRIAVITAEHGAALQDFLNVLKRRSLWMDVVIIPAMVQGESAARTMISALSKAQNIEGVEVIVLTRGGGSLEDLWSFNDENLVKAIANSRIPVISAVGHEVDYSLSDYVADQRCETPTAAAETLSQPQTELAARIQYCQSHLKGNLFKAYQEVQLLIHKFHPLEMLSMMKQKVQKAEKKLLSFNLMERAPELIGHQEASQKLDEYFLRLNHSTQIQTSAVSEKLKRFEQVLSALNPKKVLERGYSYAEVQSGEVIASLKQFNSLAPHEKLKLTFHDGAGTVVKES